MANDHRQALNGAEVFIRALENEGVKYIFAVPGEENLAFLEALRNSSIRLVLNRHEQAAGFMAATYGRLTGQVGVCLSTLGPGATNLVTAAAYAQLGGMPMMMISGQKPIKSSKQGLFQILDVVDLMRPLTKYTRQISNANTIPAKVREAFRLASEERPGAVHLELPEDIAEESAEAGIHIFNPSDARRPTASEKSLDMACDMLRRAHHPLIMIGAGANRKRVSKALLHLVDVAPYDGSSPVAAVRAIEHELEKFSETLANRPRWLVLNKVDMLPEAEREAHCQAIVDKLGWTGPVFRISALSGEGTRPLVQAVMRWIEARAEEEAQNPEAAEAEAERRRRMDEEARAKLEADRQARRAARHGDDDDDDFDDDDYDVEVVYAPE